MAEDSVSVPEKCEPITNYWKLPVRGTPRALTEHDTHLPLSRVSLSIWVIAAAVVLIATARVSTTTARL